MSYLNDKNLSLGLLHDAKLAELHFQPEKTIALRFLLDDEERLSIQLNNVFRFKCNNALEGNIVFEAHSTQHENLSVESAITRIESAFSDELGDVTRPVGWNERFRLISEGKLHVFVIDPTYGAEIVAICDGIILT